MGRLKNKQVHYKDPINFDGSHKITSLAAGTVSTDAVNFGQLQAVAAGYDPKASVRVATAVTLTLTTDYTRTGSGSTHLLTASANGILSLDGISTGWVDIDTDAAINDPNDPTQATRVLVKDSSDSVDNGIYVVQDKGTAGTPWKLLRAADQDGTPTSEVSTGNSTFVSEGTAGAGTGWVVLNDGANTGELTVDTHNLNWTQIGTTNTYSAGNGIDSAPLATGTIQLDLDGTSNGTSGLGLAAGGISISSAIAGTGLFLTSGVLSIELDELSAGVVNVANDSFAFTDADDSGNTKLESIADLATAFAGTTTTSGLSAASGVLTLNINGLTVDSAIAATDTFAMYDGANKKVPFSLIESSLSIDGIQPGSASGQLMIWDVAGAQWDNATLTVGTGNKAGISVVNGDGTITVGVDITGQTSITGGAVSDGDEFLVYDADGSTTNVKANMSMIAAYVDTTLTYDNYGSWTLSDGAASETIASGNTVTFADSNGITLTVTATDTLTAALVADVTGGANLASVVKLNGNGIAIGVDDITIEETTAGGNLRVKANGISANELNVSGNGSLGEILSSDGDGSFSWVADDGGTTPVRLRYASAVVASGIGVAVSDVFGANDPSSTTIPAVYINGHLAHVSEDTSGDCWFVEDVSPASGNAVAFADLTGNEALVWSETNALYGLDANDNIELRFNV